MALAPDQKFSTFSVGGDLAVGDTVVGLRGGINTKFIFTGEIPAGVIVPIINGGTGASTALGARSNLGLGTISTQDADNVAITGGIADLDSGTIVAAPVNPNDLVNKAYVDSGAGGVVASVVGTVNQINVNSTDPANPILTISSTLNLPGTFNIQGTIAVNAIINDNTLATATSTNLSTALALKTYIDNASGGVVDTIIPVTNQTVVDSTTPSDPIVGLSSTLSAPGTFTIQGTTAVDAIINDNTLATATATNLATALSIKTYVDNAAGGTVDTVVGTTNQINVNSTDPLNPVVSISSTLNLPGTFTIQGTTAVSAIINDDTMATAAATNIPTALSVKTYVLAQLGTSVTSATGTANQVLVNATSGTPQAGALTFTLPQSIGTGDTPQFVNLTLTSGKFFDVNTNTTFSMGSVASSVNYVEVTPSATGNAVVVAPAGTDTNIQLNVYSKGTSGINFGSLATTNQFSYLTGTTYQHTSIFNFPSTAASRTVTWQDADGTVAYLSDISGTGTVSAGSINQIAWYAANGTTVSGLATANNGVLVTSAGGVPSISGTLPNSVQLAITSVGAVAAGTWNATTVGILYGGTGVTSVTTAPVASAFSGWDANSNLSANAFIEGFATQATAAGTTVLTVASKQIQEFTGALTQTITLPVAATMVAGMYFDIINNSSGALTINSSGANLVLTMAANTSARIVCVLNSGTTAASWNASYFFDNGAGVLSITGTADQVIASASTGAITLSLPQSIATTSTPTFGGLTLTAALTVPNGGTGLQTTTAYAVLCGGTTSTGALQSIASVGTAGQVLTSNGAGALPTFQAGGGGGSSITWVAVSGTTQACSVNSAYITNNAAQTTYTAPATAAVGDVIIIKGVGAGGWIMTANTGQTIRFGSVVTSSAGTVTSAAGTDSFQMTCLVANTTWSIDYAVSSGLNLV